MSSKASSSTAAPNTTLYVRNIPSKVKKPELRRQLYALFATYGKVIDVVATRQEAMREQAFIVFTDLASSTAALRALDGFSFYGRALSIDYARSKSKATIVAERGPEALFDPNLGFTADGKSARKSKLTFSSAGAELKGRERKRAREDGGRRSSSSEEDGEEDDDSSSKASADGRTNGKADGPPEEKRFRTETNGAGDEDADEMQMANSGDESSEEESSGLGAPLPAPGNVANNLLFISDLPADASEASLSGIFDDHAGFAAVQVVPAKAERTPPATFAFVEFKTTRHASAALKKLQGYKFSSGLTMQIAFSRRASA